MDPVESKDYVFSSGGTGPVFFISTTSSPTRFATPDALLGQDLLPGR